MNPPNPTSIVSAFQSHLKADAGVVAAAMGGVHLMQRPQAERRPCLIIERRASEPDHNHDGPSGFVTVIMGITAIASTHALAHAAATAARLALDGFRGSMPGPVLVDGVFLEDEADSRDEDYDADVIEQVYLVQQVRSVSP